METIIINDKEKLSVAADILKKGGLVAVPTETVYGLAADCMNHDAVEKIYEVKGRPEKKALSVMVAGPEAMECLATEVPDCAKLLAEKFWPGPLTIVLNTDERIPAVVRAGGKTIALRCPDQEMTEKLLKDSRLGLAAPSANPSGAASPKTAGKVLEYFSGKIDAVIDGGECTLGTESTIIDLSRCKEKGMSVLRAGALAEKDIRRTLIKSIKVYGITGGTGCGKTTALNVLKEQGALIIDADAVYYRLCEENMDMLASIENKFPGVVVNGVLQRKKLGTIVFKDKKALLELQSITDPYVDRDITRQLSDYAAAGGKIAAVDAINILGTDLEPLLYKTVGIVAPRKDRIQRLINREGISEEYASIRIDAQHPNEYYKEKCDIYIDNNGSKEEFKNKCIKYLVEEQI